jgi:energy-coupling factor transporter transmembrane protein EcfT
MIGSSQWYVDGSSWLHIADARVKLAMVACGMFLLLTATGPLPELAGLLAVLGLHLSAGISPAKVGSILRVLLPISVFVAVLRTLFAPGGNVLAAWGWLRLTDGGLAGGGALGLRLLAVGLLVFAWLYTTRPSALVQSLVRLGLPYSWGLVLALSLRFVPFLQHSFASILEAQQARGLVLEASKGYRRVERMMPIFVAVVISGFRSSEQLARALESRALGATGVVRSTWRPLKIRPSDGLILAVLASLTTTWAILRFGLLPVGSLSGWL